MLLQTLSRQSVASLHRLGRVLQPLFRVAYRRRIVAANLAYAFPDADTATLAERFYDAFAETYMETIRSLSIDAAELGERVTFQGAQALNRGNALLLLAHHGNLVWALTALAGEIEAPISVVYKSPHIDTVHKLLLRIARRFGIQAVSLGEVRRQLLKSRQQNRVWALVADQRPGRHRRHAELCGRRTAFHAGPERMARALNRPVYYLSCQRTAPGRYRCVVERIAEPPYRSEPDVVERYAAKLQVDIDRAPEYWLWSHERWRQR